MRADQDLKQFYSEVLPASHASARNLLYLELRNIATQNGLSFTSGVLEREAVEESSLMRMSTNVSLNGNYSNIRRFHATLRLPKSFSLSRASSSDRPLGERAVRLKWSSA